MRKCKCSKETKNEISMAMKGKKGKKCSDEIRKNMSIAQKRYFETHDGYWKGKMGKLSHTWRGGLSFEPYGIEFNKQLKKQIRTRDNYRCQQCFREESELRTKSNKPYTLHIHHINFDKKDNRSTNLISLCGNCHSQTIFNRENWTEYFQDKMNILMMSD